MKPRMHTDEHGLEWEPMTGAIIGCAYTVANTLGVGFLEEVYENALAHELRKADLDVRQQEKITIRYDGIVVGHYKPDLLVENKVIVELKSSRGIDNVHYAQCINYLKATNLPVCLLLNFGTPRVQVKRILNPALPEAWVHPADDINDD